MGSEWLMAELNLFFADGAVAPLSGEMFNYCHQGYSICEIVQIKSQIKTIFGSINYNFERKNNTTLHESTVRILKIPTPAGSV